MRVLCLHPEKSSARQLSLDLAKLEDRLWHHHGIELVFVDGPLSDVKIHAGETLGAEGGGIRALDVNATGCERRAAESADEGTHSEASRRWYVRERKVTRPFKNPETEVIVDAAKSQIKYTGLDASLLHLSQIWSRGGANANDGEQSHSAAWLPFQGVLGVGQGADVAGLLPLLNYAPASGDDEHDDESGNGEEEGERTHQRSGMFQGLQFVILIDGCDILSQRDGLNPGVNRDQEPENEFYVGPEGVDSLHIIRNDIQNCDHDCDKENVHFSRRQSSERLAKQYGPNAQIHRLSLLKTSSSKRKSTTNAQQLNENSKNSKSNYAYPPQLLNLLGKYLVSRKNKHFSSPASRQIVSLQTQLAQVEQLATLKIVREIERNPPKALMAVVGPAMVMDVDRDGDRDEDHFVDDGDECVNEDAKMEVGDAIFDHNNSHCKNGDQFQNKSNDVKEKNNVNQESKNESHSVVKVARTVGAWQGPRRRGIGEEGGGAPCPETFLKREEDRR
mmetsp:Transcript_26553/g.53338  ORF Transcript_26553/g.53338 Transcript_26553/m.53338 type:complete len:504 (+) Transcript_26553:121-1632(+)